MRTRAKARVGDLECRSMSKEKRARQKQNRQQQLAQKARAARAARWRRRLNFLPLIVGVAALLFWLAGRSDIETDGAAVYDGFRAQPTACGGSQPDERVLMTFDSPADLSLSGTVSATLDTSCGPIELSLDADAAPESVNSFAFLAQQGYFDGTVCHRLLPGFMLQCGDQTATGTGGPGYAVPDEFPAEGFVYAEGVVAMANAGAGTTGSQFFLVIGDASFLPPEFSVLGSFTDPGGTVAALIDVPLGISGDEQSGPLETIYLNSVAVEG